METSLNSHSALRVRLCRTLRLAIPAFPDDFSAAPYPCPPLAQVMTLTGSSRIPGKD